MDSKHLDRILIGAVLISVGLAGSSVWERYITPFLEGRPHPVSDWAALVSDGHRQGASRAAVLAVVFLDYECPACRSHHAILKDLLEAHPEDFAVVYRDWPLRSDGAADLERMVRSARPPGVS